MIRHEPRSLETVLPSTAKPTSPLSWPDKEPTGVVASFLYAFSSFPRLRTEVLGGLAVALALIPEAISFSILAGVDPRVGLFVSFIMAVTIAFTGGRPAMVSAATGAVAVVIAPVARDYGMDYLIGTVLLAGIFQVILALIGVPWLVYPLVTAGLIIMVGLPKLATVIPAPLVTIIVLTAAVIAAGWNVPTVRDQGELPTSFQDCSSPMFR